MPSSDAPHIRTIGDDLLSVAVKSVEVATAIAEKLRLSGGWLESVAGIDSVVAKFDIASVDLESARERFASVVAAPRETTRGSAKAIDIPVAYGGEHGPDLGAVCARLGLSAPEFIARHTAAEYTVDMLGFTPGFAYLSGLDPSLNVPRRDEPRQFVAAGSLGIADTRSGLYALAGPGGWSIVGRTPLRLFDAAAENPFLLAAGSRVRFVAISPGSVSVDDPIR